MPLRFRTSASWPALLSLLALALVAIAIHLPAGAATNLSATPRGLVVETDRYRAEITDGALTSFTNRFTGEDYFSGNDSLVPVRPHIPSGLGTQNGADAFAAMSRLFTWPWNEFSAQEKLPNQHFADAKSSVSWKPSGLGGVLEYTGLTDGTTSYPDEKYTLQVEIDSATGDLLLTPGAESPRTGVYGANLTTAPTNVGVSIEAPIFDGITITPDMKSGLWHNKWPNYWDYGFIGLNGARRGAVGIWTQDAGRHYKDFFFLPLPDNGGIGLAFGTMNVPPFDQLRQAEGVTWRVQAFDKSWAQAAARFRDWRVKSGLIAPRPEWTKQISFVNNGVNANKRWLDILTAYLNGDHLERTVTFAPVVRAAAFDTKHWDNTPYAAFKSDMAAWKAAGAHLMAYLQPMIFWGFVPPDDAEAQKVAALDRAANTISPFQSPPAFVRFVDQHHLGEPGWQGWFLNWVKVYIQDDGADGVYHDSSYQAPVDGRGLINGMTPPQGLADYFYKVATQNPNAIEGTEHLQECNSVGASLGIGSGILWGRVPDMRRQRILHPSPVSNALGSPTSVIYAFPHFSDFGTRGDATLFHWGMDIMEGRGDIAGLALQNSDLYSGTLCPFTEWVNEVKLDRDRSLLFVHNGLRPTFPDDWDRDTLSYFCGANGEDFRYQKTGWGSRFVQMVNGQPVVQYGRAHGNTHAAGPEQGGGNVAGWMLYNDDGPAGLNPDRYYVLDPKLSRPAVYFSPAFEAMPGVPSHDSLYESYVDDGSASDTFAYLSIKPVPEIGNIIHHDKVFLHAPDAPAKIWVNGKEVPPKPVDNPGGSKLYLIEFNTPATICVLLKEPAEGFAPVEDIRNRALARAVSSINTDVFTSHWVTSQVQPDKLKLADNPTPQPALTLHNRTFLGIAAQQLHLPFKAPATGQAGTLHIDFKTDRNAPLLAWTVNGVPQDNLSGQLQVPFQPGEDKVLSFTAAKPFSITWQWMETPAAGPAPAPNKP